MNRSDHDFEQTLRTHHQAALDHLSPQVQAQLAQRRHAALRGTPVRRKHGFRYAAASFAAVAALVVGLQLQTQPERPLATVSDAALVSTSHPVAADNTAPSPATLAQDTTTPVTVLDEDPDFYAWLASDDAQLVAME